MCSGRMLSPFDLHQSFPCVVIFPYRLGRTLSLTVFMTFNCQIPNFYPYERPKSTRTFFFLLHAVSHFSFFLAFSIFVILSCFFNQLASRVMPGLSGKVDVYGLPRARCCPFFSPHSVSQGHLALPALPACRIWAGIFLLRFFYSGALHNYLPSPYLSFLGPPCGKSLLWQLFLLPLYLAVFFVSRVNVPFPSPSVESDIQS